MKHGKGKYKGNSTLILSYNGDWQNDTRHGQAEIAFSNGDIYSGAVQNGQPHGSGTMSLKSGSTIQGKWQNGVLEGKSDVTPRQSSETNPSFLVDDDGTVLDQQGHEYLVPPFIPLFQFQ